MEKSRYSAVRGFAKRDRVSFFPTRNLLVFIWSIFMLAYWLFPGQQLANYLMNMDNVSEVEFRYSALMMPTYPGLILTPDVIENDPSQAVEQLNSIPGRFANNYSAKGIWLSYIVLRTLTLSTELPAQVKREALVGMKEYFKYFEKISELNINQLKILARDALAIQSSEWAMVFYERIVKIYPEQPVFFYGEMVKAATWAKQCEKSAEMAFIAKGKALNIEDKRYFFILAIKTLFQCDKYGLGMKLAQENLKDLTEDTMTYQLLIEYAIKAGDPKLANQFLLKLLELQGFSKKPPGFVS